MADRNVGQAGQVLEQEINEYGDKPNFAVSDFGVWQTEMVGVVGQAGQVLEFAEQVT